MCLQGAEIPCVEFLLRQRIHKRHHTRLRRRLVIIGSGALIGLPVWLLLMLAIMVNHGGNRAAMPSVSRLA